MNGALSGRNGVRKTMLALAMAALVAGGALAGCGSSGPSATSIEKNVNQQLEKGDELAEETVKSVSKQAEADLEEAKTEAKGEDSKQAEEGIEEAEAGIEEGKESAEKGIEEGKAEAKKAEEEAKKQIEEATK
jgi:hypothetical protein